jgi:hypothetical protein
MAEKDLRQQFNEKYGGTDQIWSGHSFAEYAGLRELLEELPVSEVPEPVGEYPCRFYGILDNVYGDILYTVLEYEGYFKDKAYHIDRCTLKPFIRPHNTIIAFNIDYTTKNGKAGSQSFEIIRNDDRNYIFFTEKYRTS